MSDNTKLLEEIYRGAQMGSEAIAQLTEKAKDDPDFLRAIEAQHREYASLMEQAGADLRERGAEPDGIGSVAKLSSRVMNEAKTLADDSVENMAEMLIKGSTMGVTKLTRRLGELDGADGEVRQLAERLLATEETNIEQMKKYLK